MEVEVAVVLAVVDVAINGGHLTLIRLLIKIFCIFALTRKCTAVLMVSSVAVNDGNNGDDNGVDCVDPGYGT